MEERHLGDQFPSAQELPAPQLLGIAGGENAGPQREDQNAADHDHSGQHPAGDRLRHDIAIAGGGQGHDRPPQRRRD